MMRQPLTWELRDAMEMAGCRFRRIYIRPRSGIKALSVPARLPRHRPSGSSGGLRLGQLPDMLHHAEMHVADDASGPEIEVPRRDDMQAIPARSGRRGGAVAVIVQQKPSLVERQMPEDLRVRRLPHHIEGQLASRLVDRHHLIE